MEILIQDNLINDPQVHKDIMNAKNHGIARRIDTLFHTYYYKMKFGSVNMRFIMTGRTEDFLFGYLFLGHEKRYKIVLAVKMYRSDLYVTKSMKASGRNIAEELNMKTSKDLFQNNKELLKVLEVE